MQRICHTTALAAQTVASTLSQTIDLNSYGDPDLVGIQVNYANATTAAKTFISGTYEVQTLTYPTKSGAANGDYLVVQDQAGTKYAIALVKPVAAVSTFTTANKAGSTGGDYGVFYDGSGLSWAFALNVSGSDPAPTGAVYTAVNSARKVNVDVSGATTATDIADLIRTAMNALTGFTAAITLSGTATLIVTRVVKAPVTASSVHNANDSGAGSITVADGTAGVASQTPTGAAWTAVGASQKGLADISGDSTAAQVAARAKTAWDALTGFTTNITSADNSNGTLTFTQALTPGPVTDPVSKTYNDSGAGSATGVETTPGVASKVNLTDNTASITAHGQKLGAKGQLTTSGSLPTGLSTSTDCFIIVVDVDTIKFATSLANAVAGTAVDITGYGVGTQTFTPTTSTGNVIKARYSHDDTYYTDILYTQNTAAAATVTVATTTGGVYWDLGRPSARYLNLLFTPSAGTITFSVLIDGKKDK